MWQFMFGFVAGVYVGTKYDCKPTMDYLSKMIEDNMPKEKGQNKMLLLFDVQILFHLSNKQQ